MAAFTINIPIRTVDSEDVKNAFAFSYGYAEQIQIGGVTVSNPITKEEFVKQKCVNFMLDVVKAHLIKVEENNARLQAEQAAVERALDVTQWFDGRRLESIGGNEVLNRFPVVMSDSFVTSKNQFVDFEIIGFDHDNLPLTFMITQYPTNGTLSGTSPNYRYTPNTNFFGLDNFKVKANNGTLFSLEKTLNLNVVRGLISNDAYYVTRQNQSIEITLTSTDNTGNVIFNIAQQPSNGQLSGTNPYLYVPNTDYIGADSFTFTSSDDVNQNVLGTITLQIKDIIAISQTNQTNINTPITFSFFANNAVGNLTYNIITPFSNGTLTQSNLNYIYTPNNNFRGYDTAEFTATDDYGTSQIATYTMAVEPVEPLSIINLNFTLRKNQNLNFEIAASNYFGDYNFTLDNPQFGTISGTNPYVYTPNADFTGLETFDYFCSDGTMNSNTSTITINVDDILAMPETSYTVKNTEIDINLSAMNVIGNLTFSIVNQPQNGVLILNQNNLNYTYTPNIDFVGTDVFEFTATDNLGTSQPATYTIEISE